MIVGAKALAENGDELMVTIPEQIEWRVKELSNGANSGRRAMLTKKLSSPIIQKGVARPTSAAILMLILMPSAA